MEEIGVPNIFVLFQKKFTGYFIKIKSCGFYKEKLNLISLFWYLSLMHQIYSLLSHDISACHFLFFEFCNRHFVPYFWQFYSKIRWFQLKTFYNSDILSPLNLELQRLVYLALCWPSGTLSWYWWIIINS